MENTGNIETLNQSFNFLTSVFNFKIQDVESYNHALYAKFITNEVGIYFIYEFRDFTPQIQFTKLDGEVLKVRPGLYTMREFYKDENFILYSFYLDEILSFKNQEDYRSCFKNAETVEEAIKISSKLAQQYAMEYIEGDELSYREIDKWYKTEVMRGI